MAAADCNGVISQLSCCCRYAASETTLVDTGFGSWMRAKCPFSSWSDSDSFVFSAHTSSVHYVDFSTWEIEIASANYATEFLNSWLPEADAEYTSVQPAQLDDQLARASALNDGELPLEGEGGQEDYFYSALHGYRIKKPETSDTSSEYKRILRDIKV